MRVAVSGFGAVSGAGIGGTALLSGWQKEGTNLVPGAQSSPPFNAPQMVVAALEFDARTTLGKKGLQFLTRGTHLLLAASQEALTGAMVDTAKESERLGLVIGTNFAGLNAIANYDWTTVSEGPSFVSAMDTPNVLANAPASHLAIRIVARGPNTTISTGRCASLDALGYAAYFLKEERVGIVVAGGVEETNPHVLWYFEMAAESGMRYAVPGEAAAVVVLRGKDEHRKTDQFPTLAWLGAWANTLNPAGSPESQVRDVCLEALDLAEVKSTQISLVAAGIGTPADSAPVEGMRNALCSNNRSGAPIPTFSLKSLVGETLGAAGALHVVAAVEAFRTRTLPASCGLAGHRWPPEFLFTPQPIGFVPGPALIVDWDPLGFASAVVLLPENDGRN
jgi:3-oxoacyl-[acyl-carrier-protein] synthase II